MSWLRLEATFFQNPTIMRAGWEGSVVFLAAMTMSKLHGWDGAVPKVEFEDAIIRRHLGCHSDIDIPRGIEACVRVGLLIEDATHYSIKSWRKFQPDPTAARRKRDQRARERESQDVTVTPGDYRESRTTGRDETVLDGSPPSPRPGAGSPNGKGMRKRDWTRLGRCLRYHAVVNRSAPASRLGKLLREGGLSEQSALDALAKYAVPTKNLTNFERNG